MGQQRKQTIGVDIEALIEQEEEADKKRKEAKRQEELNKLRVKKATKAKGEKADSSTSEQEASKATKKAKKRDRPSLKYPRTLYGRSKKYLACRKQVDKERFYSVLQAVELLRKIVPKPANFDKTVGLTLVSSRSPGKSGDQGIELDLPNPLSKKPSQNKVSFDRSGLLRAKIGKISWKAEMLTQNIQTILSTIPRRDIRKAFLSATHLPSIKIKLE